jgi:2,3-dihydroxyphenylpropionate 1,2-dioxygenase
MSNPFILGGAMLPHAPQFFTQPETEDKATIAEVQKVAAKIGAGLKALKPDVWVVIGNDHAQQFFANVAPPFTLHVGGMGRGQFAGRDFKFNIASEISFALVKDFYRAGFDPAFTSTAEIDYALGIPMTHIGLVDEAVLPIYVNAYLPPQPTMERCYAFGQALARGLASLGVRAVIVASGGMSHFPGTDNYSNPALEFDKSVLEPLKEGRLKTLLGYNEQLLDEKGNIELRCWAVAAGALGERKPDIVQLNPSWHHNYASLGWYTPAANAPDAPHYPQIAPELQALTSALFNMANDRASRDAHFADPNAYADKYHLEGKHRKLLVGFDAPGIVAAGVHPLLIFLVRMNVERERGKKA